MSDSLEIVKRASHLYETERVSEAVALCEEVLSSNSRDLNAIRILALCQTKMGQYEAASKLFRRARKIAPRNPHPLIEEAVLHRGLGQYRQMVSCCKEALKLEPNNVIAEGMLADALERSGELEQAQTFIEGAIKRRGLEPRIGETYAIVKELLGSLEQSVTIINKSLEHKVPPAIHRRMLLHRGRVLEKMGRYEDAFESYTEGNAVMPAKFNPEEYDKRLDEIFGAFSPWPDHDDSTELATSELPVFIAAMPRSGTSLVERIIGSHSKVHGAGELPILGRALSTHRELIPPPVWPNLAKMKPEMLDPIRKDALGRLNALSGRRERIVSKSLMNGRNLGLIGRLFPRARVIRISRNPVDVGLSIWANTLALERMPWTAKLEWIGHAHREHDRLLDRMETVVPNPWLNVDYAKLVSEPDKGIREIIEFCGLEWEDRCASPEKAGTDTRGGRFQPTLSYQQVRQPINKKSMGRAEGYGKLLDPLRNALAGSR